MNFISVTEFNNVVKRIFNAEEMLKNIAIQGEVSGFKISGEHAYFAVKDQNSALQCTCFNCRKTYVPKDGEQVIIIGSPDYYVKGGRFSFNVTKIEAYGQGLLFAKIEELKKKLTSEGIFAEEHKKAIPRFSKSICVVTSKTGAVIRDIIKTVKLKNPVIDITVKDVRVQGDGAEREIAAALKAVDLLNYDIVILARGGGSLEDLMPFNSEIIARVVYNMATPVISAVGHETDFSICDFAADLRAATPTAAAEAAAYDYYAVIENIFNNLKRSNFALNNSLGIKARQTKFLASNLTHKLKEKHNGNLSKLRSACVCLKNDVDKNFVLKAHLLEKSITALDNLSPIRILKAGYFRLYSKDLPVMSVKSVKVGDKIYVRGSDGRLTATVETIEEI